MRKAIVLGVVGALLLLPGCQGQDDPDDDHTSGPLDVGANGSVSMEVPGKSVASEADILLCVEGDDSAELISLEARGPSGDARVSDFDVVVVAPDAYSGLPKPLSAIKTWESQNRIVTERCGQADPAQVLAIEISKSVPVAGATSFLLTYRAGGREYEVDVPFSITLCDRLRDC